MQFTWDDNKNQENIRRRGLDFEDAWQVFESPLLARLNHRERTTAKTVGKASVYYRGGWLW